MKFVSKSEAKIHKNSEACVASEYPVGDTDLDFATVEITGRYPDSGRVTNLKSKEACLILQGGGKIVIEDKEVSLEKGDLIVVEAGEKYFWDGTMTIAVTCRPPWTKEQHTQVSL